MKLGRILVASWIATSSACSLFVSLDGLSSDGGVIENDGSFDATTNDGATADAIAPFDAAIDGGRPFDCTTVDATFCDDFNRDTPIASDDRRWSRVDCKPSGSITIEDGGLVTNYPASNSDDFCYLESVTVANSSHFTLDFDMTFVSADTTSTTPITVASISLDLGNPNALGIENEDFQFLLDSRGEAQLGIVSYFPDAAASPAPGNSYIYSDLATLAGFVTNGMLCHVTLDVDTVTPKGSGSAICAGERRALVASSSMPLPGFAAPTVLDLGFENSNGPAPSWSITYDNMVFSRSP